MNKVSLHEIHASVIADEIVALLTLCQQLQFEKNGRERPSPEQYSRDEDEFADRIRAACSHAMLLRQLLPMMHGMSAIGAELERRGDIHVAVGEDYVQKALARLIKEHLPIKDNKQ